MNKKPLTTKEAGRLGGLARKKALENDPDRRHAIAMKAAKASVKVRKAKALEKKRLAQLGKVLMGDLQADDL